MSRLSKIGAAALAAFGWTSGTSAVTATYLVVAGGGGATNNDSGGGGAGGYRTATLSLSPAIAYTVTVGAGGASTSGVYTGNKGSDSTFSTITSTGGGQGSESAIAGGSGGSGGGGGWNAGAGGAGNTPSTSPSQGNNGGGGSYSHPNYGGGGGGGATGVGGTGNSVAGGAGGAGTASSISGTSVTYAGGGGGGYEGSGSAGTGGAGGGGTGGKYGVSTATSGTANLGGGGGGGGSTAGGSGGSGVVIISYVGAQKFSGGVVTSVGGNTIHTFNTSGTLGVITSLTAASLVVAGGGGGSATGGGGYGGGGGGGAGGYLTGSGITIDPNTIYVVTVGAAGVGGVTAGDNGTSGGNSVFLSNTSIGGGRGASFNTAAASGGSGGGKGYGTSSTFGTGTAGQGNNGGSGTAGGAGGGGGASAVGGNGTDAGSGTFPQTGGAGGSGSSSSISGTAVTYAGGGGGGGYAGGGGGVNGSVGGAGGGGAGGGAAVAGTAGTANLGGGGGAGGGANLGTFYAGANGGSGVVIISYPGATQQMAGGIVTISGGNVIHTFNTSGYLTPITYYTKSLRFRAAGAGYLSRTFPVASNRTTFTWSGWVKRGKLGAGSQPLFSAGSQSNVDFFYFGFDYSSAADKLVVIDYPNAVSLTLYTTQVLRDPAAWYHIVLSIDTTQATAANRVKLYINGAQVTSFSTETYPSQNSNTRVNSADGHVIGSDRFAASPNYYFDGELAAINFIDGQALAPTAFGTFNSYNQWQPITYGGSYGTNGFYLPLSTTSAVAYAGVFNGSSQYLSMPLNAGLTLGSGDFTIEAFIFKSTSAAGEIFGKTGSISYAIDCFVNSSNLFGITLSSNGTATTVITSVNALVINRWYHVAWVRSGTTINIYVNGRLDGTGTFSGAIFSGSNVDASGIGARLNVPADTFFNGCISNLRVVKGTAVYTANFVPSLTALTAIANTSLLTLQDSTFIDNSGNSISITNNASATTGQTYPFAIAIFDDASPNGNHWTGVNILGSPGSTLDYMTDVPTLTSNTAANYAVLNPLDKGSGMGVTAGNLTATVSSASIVLSSIGVSTGKWYWEMTRNGGSDCVIGIATASVSRTVYLGSDANGWGYIGSNGNKTNTATSVAYGSAYASGVVVGVALDLIAGTVTFYRNNVSQTTAYSNLTDTFFFAAFGTGNSGDSIFANFGQQPFVYTPPSGYLALNTYNLDATDTTTYFAAPISYLVVGGGGAGSGTSYGSPAGGGGAGGYRTAADVLVPSGVALTVTVGAGAVGSGGAGASGGNSSFYRRLSNGGGGGYYYYLYPAGDGGSGGGGGGSSGAGGTGNLGRFNPSEGNNGGNSNGSSAGGGGGAGGAGGTGSAGAGLTWLNGTTYAAGGYGGGAPPANTGNGGLVNGGSGASGVVIIRYADSYPAATSTTGSPTIVVSGGFRTYTFTATGTITF